MPDWLECVAVLFICFGLSVANSVAAVVSGAAFTKIEFTNTRAFWLLIAEPALAAICVSFLYLRGYKLWEKLRFSLSWKAVAGSLGLLIATYVAYAVVFNVVLLSVGRQNFQIAKYTVTANFFMVLFVSLINPLFEEVFVVGYVFDKMQNSGVVLIAIVSTLVRVSYHMYQGWIGLISILPLGILFALAYSKTKNLMPLYLAHALMDLTGLALSPHQ